MRCELDYHEVGFQNHFLWRLAKNFGSFLIQPKSEIPNHLGGTQGADA